MSWGHPAFPACPHTSGPLVPCLPAAPWEWTLSWSFPPAGTLHILISCHCAPCSSQTLLSIATLGLPWWEGPGRPPSSGTITPFSLLRK